MFDILDYLQVEIKKNVNALKESMTKRLNENEFIKNNENTVDDDSGNVESATDDSNNGNFIRTCKKIFWVVNFVFIK
jgi:hypothetical protein